MNIKNWTVLYMAIGERLKEEREAKKLTLDDIQKMTKIQTRYLYAIENENFEVMPGAFYVRAFIKEYAMAVNLNPEELMEEYHEDLPFNEQEASPALSRVQSSKKNTTTSVSSPAIFSFLPTVIVVLLIIGIVVVVWLFKQGTFSDLTSTGGENVTEQQEESNGGDTVELPPDSDAPAEEDANNEEDAENEEETTEEDQEQEQEEETASSSITLENYEDNESTYELQLEEEELILSITSSDRNWLEVYDENEENFYEKELTAEEGTVEFDFSDKEQISLRFGAPNAIDIDVNDLDVELSEEINAGDVPRVYININR